MLDMKQAVTTYNNAEAVPWLGTTYNGKVSHTVCVVFLSHVCMCTLRRGCEDVTRISQHGCCLQGLTCTFPSDVRLQCKLCKATL